MERLGEKSRWEKPREEEEKEEEDYLVIDDRKLDDYGKSGLSRLKAQGSRLKVQQDGHLIDCYFLQEIGIYDNSAPEWDKVSSADGTKVLANFSASVAPIIKRYSAYSNKPDRTSG